MGIKLGSLFDGSGGFPLAGVMHGIEPVWASEIEPFQIRVTKARFPHMKHLGDVTKINGAEIEPVDIITWGSPCQDLSVAGKQTGLSGSRSGLYKEAVRIIREMYESTGGEFPKYGVFENVPGLLSSNHGNDFIAALDMMQDIGFIPDANILDAQNMGVPQRRKRVYIAWLNVNHIVNQKTILSKIITIQLLQELLLTVLVEQLRALGSVQKELDALSKSMSADGAKKRIKLFSLQREDRLQMLQENLEETQAIYQNERENWDFIVGKDRMENPTLMDMVTKSSGLTTELPSGYIAELLKKVLGDLSDEKRSYTTSTSTSETMGSKTSICFTALANMSNVIGAFMIWLEKTNPMYLTNCEWVQSFLTEVKVCINAERKHEKSAGWLVRDDSVWLCERAATALEKYIERNTRIRCEPEVLPVREGLRGHYSPCGTEREGTAADAERGAGGSGEFIRYAIKCPAAFMGGQDAKARTIAYCDDGSTPTLKAAPSGGNTVPDVVYPNVARTLTARADSSPCVDRGQNVVCVQNTGRGWWNQTDVAETLRTPCGGDSTKANLVVYGVDCRNASLDEEKTHTLQAKASGGISLNCTPSVLYDARGNEDGYTSPCLTGDHENRITDYTCIAVERTDNE